MKGKGFTLIELLIVVALIGILAVALLSAINPIEQMKKARDAGRKSDSAELLNAYERYYSTYGCWPWDGGVGTVCDNSPVLSTPIYPGFAGGENSERLLPALASGDPGSGEIKEQFKLRDNVTNTNTAKRLWVYEDTARSAVSVCFEPESKTARTGGLGKIMPDKTNTGTPLVKCPTITYPDQNCYICVPQ